MTKKRASVIRKRKRLQQRRQREANKGKISCVNLNASALSCSQLRKRRSILDVFFGNKRGRVHL